MPICCRMEDKNGLPGIDHCALQCIIVYIMRHGEPSIRCRQEAYIGAPNSNGRTNIDDRPEALDGTVGTNRLPAFCCERLPAIVEIRQRLVVSLCCSVYLHTYEIAHARVRRCCKVVCQATLHIHARELRACLCCEERCVSVHAQPCICSRSPPHHRQLRMNHACAQLRDDEECSSNSDNAKKRSETGALRHSPALHAAQSVPTRRTHPYR